MKKILKNLERIITNIEGKLICIGLNDDYLINKISNNTKILYCDLLNSNSTSKSGKGKKKKTKNLSIDDFKKYYKKKNINYSICNINDIKKHLPKFIPNSIYINNTCIYIYGNKDSYDFKKLVKKYKRYNVEIDLKEEGDYCLLSINVKNSKNHFILDKIYFLLDSSEKLIEMISDLIVS